MLCEVFDEDTGKLLTAEVCKDAVEAVRNVAV